VALADLPDLRLLLRFEVYLPHYFLPDALLGILIRIRPALLASHLSCPLLLVLSCPLLLSRVLSTSGVYTLRLARPLHGVSLPVLREHGASDQGQGYTQQCRA
jgi:hypothetical protein